jgi:hypothetical protein
MKKQFAVLAVAVFAAACSDAAMPTELDLKAAQPNTSVTGGFTITSPEQTVVTYRTTPKSAQGSCQPGGVFVNSGGNSQGANHTQCTDVSTTPGAEIVVILTAVANYVQPNSGNIQLNFTSCGYVEDEEGNWIPDCDSKAYVHYKKNSNEHAGSGALLATGEDGSEWIISLGQIGGPGAGGLAPEVREFSGLLAQKVGSDDVYAGATFTW